MMFRIATDLKDMNDTPKHYTVRWEQGETVIEMAFDRLGRRVWMREREGDTVTKEERFVYDGYLCVQRLDVTDKDGNYLLPDNAVDAFFQRYADTTKRYNSKNILQNEELDCKIEKLLSDLECCHEEARR